MNKPKRARKGASSVAAEARDARQVGSDLLSADGRKTAIQLRNEKKILDAAELVFSETGFSGASIDEIAGRAGMSKPNLHYYYRRKIDLYVAVLDRIVNLWNGLLEDLDQNEDPAEELGRYIRQKFDSAKRHPIAFRVFATEIIQGAPVLKGYLKGPMADVVDRKVGVIQHWIDTKQLNPVDPHHLLFMIWATTQHYSVYSAQVQAVMGQTKSQKSLYKDAEETLCSVILNGLLPK